MQISNQNIINANRAVKPLAFYFIRVYATSAVWDDDVKYRGLLPPETDSVKAPSKWLPCWRGIETKKLPFCSRNLSSEYCKATWKCSVVVVLDCKMHEVCVSKWSEKEEDESQTGVSSCYHAWREGSYRGPSIHWCLVSLPNTKMWCRSKYITFSKVCMKLWIWLILEMPVSVTMLNPPNKHEEKLTKLSRQWNLITRSTVQALELPVS